MNNKYDETLSNVASETFESLAFMFRMITEDEELSVEVCGSSVTASIAFEGPFDGKLFLRLATETIPLVAANMLGMDEGKLTTPQQQDAFKELLNVVCGNLLPEIAGTEAVFNVQAPQLVADGDIPASIDGRQPLATVRLILDDGEAELACFTDARFLATC